MQGTWNARPYSGSRRRSSPSRNSPRQMGQSVAPSMPAPYVARSPISPLSTLEAGLDAARHQPTIRRSPEDRGVQPFRGYL
uniref:Uncharacterized protein n=1 Tax=Oryza nivara TaxID=4536 RepID=A0A0E0G791_ORYNI